MVSLLFVQETLSGGAGWVGAGLLGLVLGWLLLKHLPDKDKQLKELVDGKDAMINAMTQASKIAMQDLSTGLVSAFEKETKAEREISQIRHEENVKQSTLMINSLRETHHAIRNLSTRVSLHQAIIDLALKLRSKDEVTKDIERAEAEIRAQTDLEPRDSSVSKP